MSESLEELKAIIDNAPEYSTSIDVDGYYVKFIDDEIYHYSSVCRHGWRSGYASPCELRSLSDIELIIELMEWRQSAFEAHPNIDIDMERL